MLEREVKIRFPDPDLARAALAGVGAVPLRPRRLQDDTLFDTADSALRARRAVVRLRREPDRAFVTYKGPVQEGPMKMREEQETEVADADVVRRVLQEIGLQAWFRYQKFREEFEAPGVVIALDETPVGTYLEIEGSEEGILTIADALGCSPADFILDSYRGLFLAFAQAHNVTARDMLFDVGDMTGA
ncbi:MAG TPA: class IV adenylate cyclase [Vicinamibacterales bacterium]|jgi:adenylate cyclase class 2|nr:class IV adenylate cyclase [Vicinamibacterales bacterium]